MLLCCGVSCTLPSGLGSPLDVQTAVHLQRMPTWVAVRRLLVESLKLALSMADVVR